MNKTVIITGSSKGLGAATAHTFAKHGYNIVINYLHSEDLAKSLKKDLEEKYSIRCLTIKADISNEEEVKKMIDTTIKEFKQIDCLVNNASIAIDSTIEDKTVQNFQEILNINLIGTFLMCKYGGLAMEKQGYGSIVNISSSNAIDSFYPYGMDYDASKAGVISLTHNFANLYAPNIRVNCVAPGWINTPMNKNLDEAYIEQECEHILLNRFAEPEEIASMIHFVSEATYLNDAIIKIDGGRK